MNVILCGIYGNALYLFIIIVVFILLLFSHPHALLTVDTAVWYSERASMLL